MARRAMSHRVSAPKSTEDSFLKREKVYAIIPARGGSKGVPRKNIRLVGGHPLIAYSIVVARRCHNIDRVIVSTDSPEIADIARAYGAEAPFLRPPELAQDTSADMDFIRHALDWFQQHDHAEPAMLVHLRPTTPLREGALIDSAIDLIAGRDEATSLRSAHQVAEPPEKMFRVEDGFLTGLFPDDPRPDYHNLPRQAFPPAYHPNGYVDVVKTDFVRRTNIVHGPRILGFLTPFSVEVDTEEDFDYLEYRIQRDDNPLEACLAENLPQPLVAESAY